MKTSKQGRVFFTADTHFGHNAQALRRGYSSVAEHDKAILRNWNAVVSTSDDVFIVGDFAAYCPTEYAQDVLDRLKGRKHLILGNHDEIGETLKGWSSPPRERRTVTVDGQQAVLDHYAGRVWFKSHKDVLQLFGHCHNRLPGNDRQLDVGVDAWDMTPVSMPQILARLADLPAYRSEEIAGRGEDADDQGFRP